jgi:hypothetical protein
LTSVGTLTSLSVSGAGTFTAAGTASSGSLNLTSTDPFIRYTISGGTADQSKWDVRAYNNSGGYFAIRTVNDANAVFTERMNIRASTGDVTINNGNLVIGTSGKGIDFSANANAAGMTSELLNDYEEGTWTPSIGGNATYTIQTGSYTKIGKMVQATFYLTINVKGTGSNTQITGLPFTSAARTGGCAVSYWLNTAVAVTYISAYTYNGTALDLYSATAAATGLTSNIIFTNNTTIQGCITYEAA